jgi:hypothetical protein
MKKTFIIIGIILLTIVNNCVNESDKEYVEYKIKVDKITMPDTVTVSDTVSIKFDGIVGGDGCHRFKRFEVLKSQNEILFTLWGERPNFSTMCTAVIVNLNGKEYKTIFDNPGIHIIKILQPDNSILMKTIFVN